jgi:hypothetical protein
MLASAMIDHFGWLGLLIGTALQVGCDDPAMDERASSVWHVLAMVPGNQAPVSPMDCVETPGMGRRL